MRTVYVMGGAILGALVAAHQAITMHERQRLYRSFDGAFRRIEAENDNLLAVQADLMTK